jgi:DNA-directed RNA polymerase specialized sigma subunit
MKPSDNLFRKFVNEMDLLLKEEENAQSKSQRHLLNDLFKLESDFKKNLLSSRSGELVYEKFMEFILGDKADGGKENKLSIRPYFRERQNTFSNKVFPILKAKSAKRLHRFRINYLFAKWALDNYKGPNKKKLDKIYVSILNTRKLLCENNLPLAINRAKLFWSKTPESHLEYMDLIQDSSRGLLEAIDKFVPPYKTVFRSVAIGRMGLNMSEDYSATLVKLPPKDKRILYRARKAKIRNSDISGKDLQSFVNESFADTTAAEIEMIEAAANQVISMDYSPDGSRPMSDTMPDQNISQDEVEKTELTNKLLVLMEKLKNIEKKILLMKHGEMYGIF